MTESQATAEGCSPESLPDVPVAAADALLPALASSTGLRSVAVGIRTTERIVVPVTGLALAGFVLLTLIGLWDRHERETADAANAPSRTPPTAAGREQPAPPQGLQLGKLVASGVTGSASQGMSIALSADGSTAIVGGPGPNNADSDRSPSLGPVGAAWVFVRNGRDWTQQGDKLVGATTDRGGALWSQGASVALSADGNTAIVGGPSDNSTTGAAWVFTRNGGAWTQQGRKLVGIHPQPTGKPAPPPGQGMSVALSADGNTAIVGGWRTEAAWVFTRVDGAWSKEGQKLVGSGAAGSARQGASVALSADGGTAIVGGWSDNGRIGAAWVFTRSGSGAWSQQGKKLVGTNAVGRAGQGTSVALSADGNTAIVGGPGDNPWDRSVPFGLGAAGAAWVFTRTNGVWTQQGSKLVGAKGTARQGMSVALSADGNVVAMGGSAEGEGVGAVSVFTRRDGRWTLDQKLAGSGAVGRSAPAVALSADGAVVMVGGSNDSGGVGAAWVFTRESGSRAQDSRPAEQQSKPTEPPATPPILGSIAATGGADGGVGGTSGFSGSEQEQPAQSASSDPAVFLEE
jgi:hypothetical protein